MSRVRLSIVSGALTTAVAVMVGMWAGLPPWGGADEDDRPQPAPGASAQVSAAYGQLPLSFVENTGQTDGRVRFLSQGARYSFFLTKESVVMSLLQADGEDGVNLSLDFVDPNPDVSIQADAKASATVSYLRGGSPMAAQTGLSTFGETVYRELWPGIDLALRGQDGVLKYEFRVQPGARINDIGLTYRGAERLELDGSGNLLIDTAIGTLHDSAPVSYQVVDGKRVEVGSHYVLEGERSYGFAVGDHDRTQELIIDPGLAYSTFLGGFGNQVGEAIAVDASGNAYVTGFTQSPTFPTTPGAFDRTGSHNNDLDVFVSKLNATGTGLVYSTFLGGGNFDWGRDIAIDAGGNAYVTGQTKSSTFPTTSNAFDRSINTRGDCPRCGIDVYDAFVTKLNANGSGLVYSTFLGGSGLDDGMYIAVDDSGRAYVTGETGSDNFPTRSGSFDTTHNGVYDVFVTKFNASGSGLVYSSFLGGAEIEHPSAIDIDSAGSAVVVASTSSEIDYPTTSAVLDPAHVGWTDESRFDGVVSKLNAAGSELEYSTFMPGASHDSLSDVKLDASGNAFLAGSTHSTDFPTTAGAYDTTFDATSDIPWWSPSEAFIAKLNPTGSAFEYATFLGKAGASAVAAESDGSLWLAGSTGSPDAFVTPDAWDTQLGGGADVYLAKLNATGAALEYATFLGGTKSEWARDVTLDSDGNVFITGTTRSNDFPTTDGALDRSYGGDPFINGSDTFVAKLAVAADPPSPTPPPPPPPPGTPTLVSPDDEASVTQPVTFDWTDVPDASSYTIQVDSSSGFGDPLILNADTVDSEYTTSELPDSTWFWFWRVRAVGSEGQPGDWSEARMIDIDGEPSTTPPPPDAPSLLSPADGAEVTQPFTFDWTDAADAASYRIEVDDEASFASPSVWSATTSASELATSSLPDGTLFWRVHAFNAEGTAGSYSEVRTVQVTSPTTDPPPSEPLDEPELLSPGDDARFDPGTTITFDWSDVDDAATYTIQIDDDDDFDSPYTVEQTLSASQVTVSGLPTTRMWWRVRATDSDGTPGSWTSERRFELKD